MDQLIHYSRNTRPNTAPVISYAPGNLSPRLSLGTKNSNQRNIKSGVSALSSTSSSFGTAAASTKFENTSNGIDDAVRAQALAEEEAMMNQFKVTICF